MKTTPKRAIYLLTGDIGGTNSRMGLYDATQPECKALVEKYYRNSEHIPEDCYGQPEVFPTKIVVPFLKYCWEEAHDDVTTLEPFGRVLILATLATAGMVANNQANLTNLGNMLIDGNAIEENTECKYLKQIVVCRIINDFVAVSLILRNLLCVWSNAHVRLFCSARARGGGLPPSMRFRNSKWSMSATASIANTVARPASRISSRLSPLSCSPASARLDEPQ